MNDNRPNIVLLMTDQWRGDCLGVDGHPTVQTPNIDHLAYSGTRFSQGYSACPSCIPARRSLMTGVAPASTGMVAMTADPTWDPPHTLPGELKKAGYQTQLVGKLHLHPERKRYGFDHMLLADATRNFARDDNDYTQWLEKQIGRREFQPGMAHGASANAWVGRPNILPEEQTHTFWCFDQALKFLFGKWRDPSCPFFLKISTIEPHPPLTPPAFYYDRYINRAMPKPAMGDWVDSTLEQWGVSFNGTAEGRSPDASEIHLDDDAIQCGRAGYYGLCNFVDDQIGRFIQAFRHGCPNTLFIFASDHGEMLFDHHMFGKCLPYQGSVRVPFIVSPPPDWNCPTQHVCDTPVDLQDLMPTILDAANVDIPEACTGKSLIPIVRGKSDRVRNILHGEHGPQHRPEHANHWLTDGRHKYIWYANTGQEHLFDLVSDPNETHDLAMNSNTNSSDNVAPPLIPWRQHLINILSNRPEGFVKNDQLTTGQPYPMFIPGYKPNQFMPYQ